MTKRLKLKRANKPAPDEGKGYAVRCKRPWRVRHRGHTIPVHACPYCMPGAVDMSGVDES